jgi:hypothetical protein
LNCKVKKKIGADLRLSTDIVASVGLGPNTEPGARELAVHRVLKRQRGEGRLTIRPSWKQVGAGWDLQKICESCCVDRAKGLNKTLLGCGNGAAAAARVCRDLTEAAWEKHHATQ